MYYDKGKILFWNEYLQKNSGWGTSFCKTHCRNDLLHASKYTYVLTVKQLTVRNDPILKYIFYYWMLIIELMLQQVQERLMFLLQLLFLLLGNLINNNKCAS